MPSTVVIPQDFIYWNEHVYLYSDLYYSLSYPPPTHTPLVGSYICCRFHNLSISFGDSNVEALQNVKRGRSLVGLRIILQQPTSCAVFCVLPPSPVPLNPPRPPPAQPPNPVCTWKPKRLPKISGVSYLPKCYLVLTFWFHQLETWKVGAVS